MSTLKKMPRNFSKLLNVQSLGKFVFQLIVGLLLTLNLALFSSVQPVFAASAESPQTCSVGVYLLSLQDFDMIEGSFGADFWIWTNCSTKFPEALQLMDFVNSKEINASLDGAQQKGNIYWSTRKIQGVFKHDWDVSNFPFDRHVLTIEIEHGLLDTSRLVYKPEIKNSSYQKSFKLKGWQITGFSLREETHEYDTTYGDPTLKPEEGSKFSRLVLSINLERSSFISFLKLTMAVYIAVGIALAVYLIHPSRGFEPRIGALVGTLFAIVVNQQVTDATLGQTEGLKLVDQIHLTAMVYVLVAVIETIFSWRDCEKENEKTALRRDRLSFSISSISFVVVNLILIGYAALAG